MPNKPAKPTKPAIPILSVKKVVELRSGTFRNCPICGSGDTHVKLGSNPTMEDKINHILSHGYKVSHIGQETVDGLNGEPWQETVAFLEPLT